MFSISLCSEKLEAASRALINENKLKAGIQVFYSIVLLLFQHVHVYGKQFSGKIEKSDWLVRTITLETVRFHIFSFSGKFKLSETQKVFEKRNLHNSMFTASGI